MNKQQLFDNVRKMVKAVGVLQMQGKIVEAGEALVRLGLTEEELSLVTNFVVTNFQAEDIDRIVSQEAMTDYTSAIMEILKLARVAKGYEDMGEVNLTIAKEDNHLEDEVAKGEIGNGEMDSAKTEDAGTQK